MPALTWAVSQRSLNEQNHRRSCFSRWNTFYHRLWNPEIQLFWIHFLVHANRRETSNRSLTCHSLGIWGLDSPAVQTGRIWLAEVTRAGRSQMTNAEPHGALSAANTHISISWHFTWSVVKLTEMAVCLMYSSGVRALLSRSLFNCRCECRCCCCQWWIFLVLNVVSLRVEQY